jgi:hypothetical protein
MLRSGRFAVLLVLVSGAFGFDNPTGVSVTGKVTLDGEPIRGGYLFVVMTGEDGTTSEPAVIGEAGSYHVKNAPLGTVKVWIKVPPLPGEHELPPGASIKLPDDKTIQEKVKEISRSHIPGELRERMKSIDGLPKRFTKLAETDLTVTVYQGRNNIDIPLTREAPPKGR